MSFVSEMNEETGVSHLEMNRTKARPHDGTIARQHESTKARMHELGIYLHIPFCVRKCYYCDFNSGPLSQTARRDYLESLRQ